MGFIGNAIGGIFKVILSPLTSWIMSLLYGILIRGPLTVLSYLDIAFQKLSGSQVDQLLFSTSITDGHTKINFFTSDSPLKIFFMIVLGVSGALLVTFMGIMIIRSVTKKGNGPIRKVGRIAMSSAIVFAIPAMFLIVLSLSGGVLSAINGEHVKISSSNIAAYKKDVTKLSNNIKHSNQTANNSFDGSNQIHGMKDTTKTTQNLNGIDTTYTLDQIYSNLQDDKKWMVNDTIKQLGQQVQDDYQELKRLIVSNDLSHPHQFFLNKDLDSKLTELNSIINSLKPNIKNEQMADKVKGLQNYVQVVQTKINKWVEDSRILISYEGSDQTSLQNRAIANYRKAFDIVYGRKTSQELLKISRISNIQELNQSIGYLISGDPSSPGYGLVNLRRHLSDLKENSLAVTFYQVATGAKDQNWDRSIGTFKEDGFMLLIGCALIVTACVIMLMSALFAVTRIFDLALLFIVSPAVVTMSAFDDGQRMKTWLNMVIAKLIGIFGIVISLRLFGTLNDVFKHSIENSSLNKGSSGYLSMLFMQGIFGIGGMLAAYKSSQTLSGIVGAGYGIMDGMQMGQAFRMLKTGSRIAKGVATGGLATIGLKAAKDIARTKGSSSSRGVLGSVKDTWKNRSSKVNNALARVSGGKAGSMQSRDKLLSGKIDKLKQKNATKRSHAFKKAFKKENIDKSKVLLKDLKNDFKSNKKRGRK